MIRIYHAAGSIARTRVCTVSCELFAPWEDLLALLLVLAAARTACGYTRRPRQRQSPSASSQVHHVSPLAAAALHCGRGPAGLCCRSARLS